MFDASHDILLSDLTSACLECDPPEEATGLKRFGYSRDKRSDCAQVVIALIVTPEGFPVAYEVMPGNTSDKTTRPEFLGKIEKQYGKKNRLWIMDSGIPTEESLEPMRSEGASYLVGTPRGRLAKMFFNKALVNVGRQFPQGEESKGARKCALVRNVADSIPSTEPPEAGTGRDPVNKPPRGWDIPYGLGNESLGQCQMAVGFAPDSAPALIRKEWAHIHEFEDADKLPLLGRKHADFFFKGWKQAPLYVYIDA